MTKIATIRLSEIAVEAREYVDSTPTLLPSDTAEPQIVEIVGERYRIVDGFHRTAGQLRWCMENGVAPEDCEISVIVCDDGELIAVAAEPSRRQRDAIRAIYSAVGI